MVSNFFFKQFRRMSNGIFSLSVVLVMHSFQLICSYSIRFIFGKPSSTKIRTIRMSFVGIQHQVEVLSLSSKQINSVWQRSTKQEKRMTPLQRGENERRKGGGGGFIMFSDDTLPFSNRPAVALFRSGQ